MNINNAVMKDHETKPLKAIIKMPPHAIQGVSEGDSKHLKDAFGIDTVEEFANNKFIRIAQALVALAATEE